MKKIISALLGMLMCFTVMPGFASSSASNLTDLRSVCEKNTNELIDIQMRMLMEPHVETQSDLQLEAQRLLVKSFENCRDYFKYDGSDKGELLSKVVNAWVNFKYMGLMREEVLVILSAADSLIADKIEGPTRVRIDKLKGKELDKFSDFID